MVSAKVARLKGNRRVRRVRGTMRIAEKSDRLCAPTMTCAWCGGPFAAIARGNRPVALYCCKNCSHSAWRARRAISDG